MREFVTFSLAAATRAAGLGVDKPGAIGDSVRRTVKRAHPTR